MFCLLVFDEQGLLTTFLPLRIKILLQGIVTSNFRGNFILRSSHCSHPTRYMRLLTWLMPCSFVFMTSASTRYPHFSNRALISKYTLRYTPRTSFEFSKTMARGSDKPADFRHSTYSHGLKIKVPRGSSRPPCSPPAAKDWQGGPHTNTSACGNFLKSTLLMSKMALLRVPRLADQLVQI